MEMIELAGRVIGEGPCPSCNHDGQFKANKKGKLYFYCASVDDGGCAMSFQARSQKASEGLAAHISKWRVPEVKPLLKTKGPVATPAPEPEPDPVTPPKAVDPKPVKTPKPDPTPAPEPVEDDLTFV